jgi:hypothetical protein
MIKQYESAMSNLFPNNQMLGTAAAVGLPAVVGRVLGGKVGFGAGMVFSAYLAWCAYKQQAAASEET